MSKQILAGEVQLLAAGWSNTAGSWIKLQVSDEDLEAFKHLKTKSGKIEGQVLMAAMYMPAEEGEPPWLPEGSESPGRQPPATTNLVKQPPTQPGQRNGVALGGLGMLAVRWSGYDEFQKWAGSRIDPDPPPNSDTRLTAQGAGDFIKAECDIASRKDLDTDPEAAARFNQKIRLPFAAYLKEKGITP